MLRLRIYVDTSVIGGVYDEEFAESSRSFFERVYRKEFTIIVSEMIYRELEQAPVKVQDVLSDIPDDCLEEISIDEEVHALKEAYMKEKVIGLKWEGDALHVAAATIARADIILSFNFKHLVNYERIRKFNGVNALKGYPNIDIRSPWEMAYDDEDEDI